LASQQSELHHLGGGVGVPCSLRLQVTVASSDFICKQALGVWSAEPREISRRTIKHGRPPRGTLRREGAGTTRVSSSILSALNSQQTGYHRQENCLHPVKPAGLQGSSSQRKGKLARGWGRGGQKGAQGSGEGTEGESEQALLAM
jgi:hypothetical protein